MREGWGFDPFSHIPNKMHLRVEVHFAWSCYWRSEADGSQGSLPYGNAVMIRREPYGGSPSGSTKKTGHRPVGFVELMGGVEPPTFSLRMRCSAIKLHQRIALCKYNRARTIIQSVFILCLRASVPPPRLSARVSSLRGQR